MIRVIGFVGYLMAWAKPDPEIETKIPKKKKPNTIPRIFFFPMTNYLLSQKFLVS
jgi:hypothetical protein